MKTYELDIDLGFKPFKIKFSGTHEEVTIYFNPADADLPKRLFEAQKIIDEKSKVIKNFEMDENGMPLTDDFIEHTNEINGIVFDAIDYAFGNKVSHGIFKHCSPFSIINGEYFIIQFFNKIAPVLENIIKDEQGQAAAAANKYLEKYIGKGKKGKK